MSRATAVTTRPLLDRAEIDALIAAASGAPAAAPQPIHRGRRSGERLTRQPGSGADLADLRNYQPGDDIRHIDWRASARARQPMLRTWHEERRDAFVVLLDRRAAMRFGSRRRLKVTQGARLAITLLAREAWRGREVGVLLLDTPPRWVPPAAGSGALARLVPPIVAAAPPLPPDATDAWPAAAALLAARLDPDSELVLISDFNDVGPDFGRLLLGLGQRYRCRLTQISDPLEQAPARVAGLRLCWGRHCITATAARIRALQARQQVIAQSLDTNCRKAGVAYSTLSTDADTLPGQDEPSQERSDGTKAPLRPDPTR